MVRFLPVFSVSEIKIWPFCPIFKKENLVNKLLYSDFACKMEWNALLLQADGQIRTLKRTNFVISYFFCLAGFSYFYEVFKLRGKSWVEKIPHRPISSKIIQIIQNIPIWMKIIKGYHPNFFSWKNALKFIGKQYTIGFLKV